MVMNASLAMGQAKSSGTLKVFTGVHYLSVQAMQLQVVDLPKH